MATFVVQRDLPGITPEALQSAALRSKSCCAEMTSEGEPVRWIRSFFQPETQQTNCYYEGATASVIAEVNKRAGIPYTAIADVVEMTPEMVSSRYFREQAHRSSVYRALQWWCQERPSADAPYLRRRAEMGAGGSRSL